MRFGFDLCICLLPLTLIDALPIQPSDCPRRMVVFGDSFSSINATREVTQGRWPPPSLYPSARFSDEFIYIDFLSQAYHMDQVEDYAVGSATTDSTRVPSTTAFNTSVPGVAQQIQTYLQYEWKKDQANTLFIVWSGANDFLFSAEPPASVGCLSAKRAVSNLQQLMEAVPGQLVVTLNMPELWYAPALRSQREKLEPQVEQFNSCFDEAVQKLSEAQQSVLLVVDVSHFMRYMWKQFPQNEKPCVHVYGNQTSAQRCSNPAQHLFFDEYHFTSEAHAFLATLMVEKQLNDRWPECFTLSKFVN